VNILVVNYEYPPVGGGGGVICRDICDEMAAKGHGVTVVTSQYGSLAPLEKTAGVTIHRVPVVLRKKQNVASFPSMLSYVPLCVCAVNRLARRERFDVVNTHFAIPSGPAGQYIADRHRIPNVLSIHGGDIFDPSKLLSPHHTPGLKQTVRSMLLRADRVVAQSSDTMANARDCYQVERPIDIVPLGIRPNGRAAKSRQQIGLPEDQLVFSTIGRLVRRKNLRELLRVFRDFLGTAPAVLLIMGDGPEKDGIDAEIRELGLGNAVRMLGRVSEEQKYDFLNASDAYLSTAIHEGFGIVFLEAMECGLPVVCYDRGGQRDFLRDGKTGFLVALGNRDAFGVRLKELAGSATLREEMRSHNKRYAAEFYIANVAERYLTIFREAVAAR
jgi:glycosyltransferase involved in cell wall biosynthesis